MMLSYDVPLTEYVILRIADYCRKNKVPLLTTMIVGLLAYAYAFTNKFPNWDDVSCFFNKGATVGSGRWALPILSYIFPDFSMPWIYGIISLAIMAIASSVLIQEMRIQKPLLQLMFSGLVIVFPSFIGTVPFMFTLSSYTLAFLLAAVAVYCANCRNGGVKLLGMFCSVMSMGIYQAYLAVTSSFFLICLIRMLIVEHEDTKKVVKQGIYYLIHLGMTCLAYLIITYFVQQLTGESYSSYAQDRMDFAGVLSLSKIKRTYTVLITELFYGEFGFMSTPLARVCHVIAVAVVGLVILQWMVRTRDISKCALLSIIIVLLPLSVDSFVLIVTNDMIQSMLLYSFVAVYGLICMVFDRYECIVFSEKAKGTKFDIAVCAMLVILVCNIYLANRSFLQLQIANMNVYSFYTSLVTRIQDAEGFEDVEKIALIGKADQYLYDLEDFKGSENPQIRAIGFSVNIYSRNEYLTRFIGFDIEHASEEEIDSITLMPEFKEMNVYPYKDSVRKIGDIMVVKFSEPTE